MSKLRVNVDGDAAEAAPGTAVSLEQVEPGVWSVLLDGQSFEVCLDGARAFVDGRSLEVSVYDPRELGAETSAAGAGGRLELRAPMPGRVMRVLLETGAEVTAGQGILVVEAMKMQNEIPAPRPGRLVSIDVRAGDAVAGGQVLAVIE